MKSKTKQKQIQQLQNNLRNIQKELAIAQELVAKILGQDKQVGYKPKLDNLKKDTPFKVDKYPNGQEIIEGVFNGVEMETKDGKTHPVPENYASKSKLVQGDLLKLTITPQGRFIYKQIGPVKRQTKRGVLLYDNKESDQYEVMADGKKYQVLKASVTYYKCKPGDEVIINLPANLDSNWAAIESIIQQKKTDQKNIKLKKQKSKLKDKPGQQKQQSKTELEEIEPI